MMHPLKATLLTLATLGLTAGTSLAQTTDSQPADPVDLLLPPVVPVDEGQAHLEPDGVEQDAAEVRVTQALNDEIASRNQLAENQERADREAYALERARYQIVVEQTNRDRLAYEEAARQWEIERDRAEQARSRYAADLLACRAGEPGRCPRSSAKPDGRGR